MSEGKEGVPTPQSGKTETFFTRNVRGITFLICIAVFLALFGPFSVFTVHRWMQENRGTPMTSEEILRLSQTPEQVTFETLRKYRGNYNETETVRVYYIEFEHYQVLATQNKTTEVLTVLIEDFDSRVRADVLKDDLNAFLEATKSRSGNGI